MTKSKNDIGDLQPVGESASLLSMKKNVKKKIGRPPMISEIKKAQELRAKGLSFREIGKLLERDVKTIHDWVNYSVGDIVDNSHLTPLVKGVK